MKVFHCDHCGHLLFFENTVCLNCERRVGYLPDLGLVGSLDADAETPEAWRSPLTQASAHLYRLCRNYAVEEICNWTVRDGDGPLCQSCRLTRVIPESDDGAVLYLQEPGSRVGKRSEHLTIHKDGV